MANQDKDRLAGTEQEAHDQPAVVVKTDSEPGALTPQGDGLARGSGAEDNGSPAPDDGEGPARPADDGAAGDPDPADNGAGDAQLADSGDTGDPQLADSGAPSGRPDGEESTSQAASGPHRPAGFASGYPQPEQAYSDAGTDGGGAEREGSVWLPRDPSGSQSPAYQGYGDYAAYPEQSYAGYDASQGYGQDQGYGEEQGYPPEGYGPGYAQEYGEGYATAGLYGEDTHYSQGYDQDQAYGYGEGYGQPYAGAPAYGGSPAEDQPQAAAQEHGYDPARGYPGPPVAAPEPAPRQHHSPAMDERSEPGQATADSRDQVAGQPAAQLLAPGQHGGQAPVPGREASPAEPGPYPDAYRWQPPGYQARPPRPAQGPQGPQGRPVPYTGPYTGHSPYAPQAPARDGEEERRAPYGSEAHTRARPGQDQRSAPAVAEALAPLPGHDGEQEKAVETADDLTAEALLHTKRPVPAMGWRRVLYKTSGGRIHPRESAEAVRRRDLINRVRTPVAGGHHRVAVMSLKGGVGKTTTCVGLGAMLASLRGDRIIALDANPDRGTLSDKVRLETAATVRDLLNERAQVRRYADVRAFTSQAPSRLEVLASDRDPAVSIAFSEEDYYDAARVLEHFYSISLTDCGTGLLHSAMAGVLRMTDQIVLVSSPSVDGARSASATLDWLDAHGYGDLVRNAVVVLSMIRPRSKSTVDLDRLENHFAGRCRAVVRIPYDAHLEEGAEVDLEQMAPATVNAYLVLAATVGDGFAWPRRRAAQPA